MNTYTFRLPEKLVATLDEYARDLQARDPWNDVTRHRRAQATR
jgi:hypothetical protein